MGLDDFKTDDSDSSSSTTSSSSKTEVGLSEPSNKAEHATQLFADSKLATPRRIKYQVKSWGGKWKYQFSLLRAENGELVMYSSGNNTSKNSKCVMVFTTIQSVLDDVRTDEQIDIWVVPWDLDKNDNISDGTYISPEDNWATELHQAVGKHIEELNE